MSEGRNGRNERKGIKTKKDGRGNIQSPPPSPPSHLHLPVAIPQRVRREHGGVPILVQLERQLASVQS